MSSSGVTVLTHHATDAMPSSRHMRNVVSGKDSSLYGLLALVKNSQPESYYSILGAELHLRLVFNYFNQQTR